MLHTRTLAFVACAVSALGQTVVVHPKRIDDVLTNPGMGIQTFQRFNGQPLNAGMEWSEAGPTAANRAESKSVDFPPTTIAYCRWFWEALEPEKGHIHWDIIDNALQQA